MNMMADVHFIPSLGHTEESYTEPNYLKHILGGIQYAIGDNNELDYAKAKTQYPPDEDRFVKTAACSKVNFLNQQK